MAAATGKSGGKADNDADSGQREARSGSDFDADIRQLREDIAKLREQLNTTGAHSYGTARRAAAEGIEQLKSQGEAMFDDFRSNAREMEDQLIAHVREKPITSLACAAGLGFFLALLSRR